MQEIIAKRNHSRFINKSPSRKSPFHKKANVNIKTNKEELTVTWFKMWNNKSKTDMMKSNSNRVTTPSKFFVVNDLKGMSPAGDNSLMKSSDSKIKNQIRLAMEVW